MGWREGKLGRGGVGRVDVWLLYCSEIVHGQCVLINCVSRSRGTPWSSIELLAPRPKTFDHNVRRHWDKK